MSEIDKVPSNNSSSLNRLPAALQEVLELPPSVRLGYAARCARRCQPLFSLHWKDAPTGHAQLIEEAIAVAELQVKDLAPPLFKEEEAKMWENLWASASANAVMLSVIADDVQSRHRKGHETNEMLSAFFVVSAVAHLSGLARSTIEWVINNRTDLWRPQHGDSIHLANRAEGACRELVGDVVNRSYMAVAAMHRTYEMDRMLRVDVGRAQRLAMAIRQDPNCRFHAEEFGELWPSEMMIIPDWWPPTTW
jgi:hypothetical protein